jgi:poly-gamma-glutamate capsule biosynthesis protein CapA/YwtB (metallophosphatase superfamily)
MNANEVKILVTGDFCPHNRIEGLALRSDCQAVISDFRDVFVGNDLNITDLECPLTLQDKGRKKTGPHQKAHPDCIKILKYADIHLAAMANNHIMDYDSVGVLNTLEICRTNGIDTVGVGRTPEEAGKPYSVNIKNKRIAILNFADNEFLSTPNGAFYCNPLNSVQCFYDIANARQNHDYLIVIIHAGNEFYELPSPRTKKLYRYIVDLGADVIISHHTHAFSGYEIYKSKPIFYGLGNFIYDWPGKINSNWNKGYVVRLTISEKTQFEIIPLNQCNDIPGVFHLSSEETEAFNKEICRLNNIIEDEQKLEAEFQKYCNSVFPMYDAFIEPNFGKYITALRKRGFFPKLMSKKKRLLLLNITRCESHRDVLLRMLKKYEQNIVNGI